MPAIHLIRAGLESGEGTPQLEPLDWLSAALARVFRTSCHVRMNVIDAAFAFSPPRNQYHSTAILQAIQPLCAGSGVRLLAITECDLFVPVLTFVFGEAQLEGGCALVSTSRLREEFYGMAPNEELLRERLLKEAVHELGHTFGLRHCGDWRCAMASTHAVERLDLKEPAFCSACARIVRNGS